jgi:hypothetical protein
VIKSVIERHLIAGLPDDVLSPEIVGKMNEQEINRVAAEAPEITKKRELLQRREADLRKGRDEVDNAMCE